jgi:hypothetical protein
MTNWSVGAGVRKRFTKFLNVDNLGRFPAVGEISGLQNVIKNLDQMDESCAGEISKHSS